MPTLVGSQLSHFVTRLHAAERCNFLTDWEQTFVNDMRLRFDKRESMEDMGMTPWSPSRNQWATLTEIAQNAGCQL